MRIATFNLWNAPELQNERLAAACEELDRIDADIVALQEVNGGHRDRNVGRVENAAEFIATNSRYAYHVFRAYPDDTEEGLAFVSKWPLRSVKAGWESSIIDLNNCGLRVTIDIHGQAISLTNVHLTYKSILTREKQIVALTNWIADESGDDALEFLCGDFNCYPESSVYRFLMGQQSIDGKDATVWHDLAASYASRFGTIPPPTLDFINNPRWKESPTLEIPARFDWIMLKDRWPAKSPTVTLVERFGVCPSTITGVVPSDHYGVFADVIP